MEKLIRFITWFSNIKNKNTNFFVNFDIVSFYQSIKEEHFIKAISFAKAYTNKEVKDINLIRHICKTITTYYDKTWIKKDDNTLFDVPME